MEFSEDLKIGTTVLVSLIKNINDIYEGKILFMDSQIDIITKISNKLYYVKFNDLSSYDSVLENGWIVFMESKNGYEKCIIDQILYNSSDDKQINSLLVHSFSNYNNNNTIFKLDVSKLAAILIYPAKFNMIKI
jgi:hypothetical protein